MSRMQFLLPNVPPGSRVRIDTASGSTSAADIVDNLNQAVSGSILTADASGRLASGDIYGPSGVSTLYMKTLDGSGNVTGTTTLSSSHPASTGGGSDPRVDTLISGAPGALDTFKELADALGDDANYAATVTSLLAGKENVVVHGSTAGTARPAGATIVHWIGSVAPTNGVTNDEWTDTTVPVKKRYSGSAWVSLSGASLPDQTGNSGKFLTTDGSSASWGTPGGGGLPANASGWLKNNGTGTLSWVTPTATDVGALPSSTTYVASFNTRTGAVTLSKADVTGTGLAAADVGALASANNLSDVASAATARTNLGLGTASTRPTGDFAQTANNLSDLASVATARTNLGVSAKRTWVSKTATYTAVDGDKILADASGGAFTVTLPAVANGVRVTVKKIDSSGNAVTVVPASGTIDGAASVVIATQYVSRDLEADATNWWLS